MDLKDAVLNLRLSNAGLAVQAVTSASAGSPPPGVDPYAPPESSLVQVSGYGRALSAISQFSAGLEAAPAASSASVSSAPAVATTSAAADAVSGTYAVEVSQLAQAQQMSSAYFADASAAYFTPGSFAIESGGNSTSVAVETGSLNGVASAINRANAGVVASVESGEFGHKLVLTAAQTGASQTFSVTAAPNDPFGWNKNLGTLALSQNRAAADASYAVNGVSATSASNQGVAVDAGVSINLTGTGSTTITVAPDYQSALNNAQSLVSQYNVLRGNINQLTASGGQLENDATVGQFSADLYGTTQNTFTNPSSSLVSMAQLGMTASTQGSAISLDTNQLQAAFESDLLGTSSLLNQIRESFASLAQGQTGTGGVLRTQANTALTGILQGIESTLSGAQGLPQSAALMIYQNQMLFNSGRQQYSGISMLV